ncbi:hypothetical protein Trydic_g11116 [Trypoxylus dichotomus]
MHISTRFITSPEAFEDISITTAVPSAHIARLRYRSSEVTGLFSAARISEQKKCLQSTVQGQDKNGQTRLFEKHKIEQNANWGNMATDRSRLFNDEEIGKQSATMVTSKECQNADDPKEFANSKKKERETG